MNDNILEIKNLEVSYEGKEVLSNFNLNIKKGDFIGITGENGSGKSTFTKVLFDLVEKDNGIIKLDGIDTCNISQDVIASKVGLLFQNIDNQFLGVTLEDELRYSLYYKKYSREKEDGIIYELLKKFKLIEFKNISPSNLSGGQKQKAAIVSMLARDPEILIFDESFTMIDENYKKEIFSIMKNLNKQGKTIILITHDSLEILQTKRVIIFSNKKVISDTYIKHENIQKILDDFKKYNIEIPLPYKIYEKKQQKNVDYSKSFHKIKQNKTLTIEDVLYE